MPENINLANQIIFSDTIEKNVKEEILDAINASKNILSNIKENDPEWEKYEEALKDYNTLKIEIQKIYLDDKHITKQELSWLKDEILSMNSHDNRSEFQKSIDSFANYTNISNTYEVINEVETKLAKISEKDAEYFYINDEHIALITNPNKLNEILKVYTDNNDIMDSSFIHLDLFNEFVIKDWVDLYPEDVEKINKENLENNLWKLINTNKTSINVTLKLLYNACTKKIDPKKIEEIMKSEKVYNYQGSESTFIDNYIWRIENVWDDKFEKIYEKYKETVKSWWKLDQKSDDFKILKNFLIQNIDNKKYSEIVNLFIKFQKLWLEIPLNTKEKSIAFIESKASSPIRYLETEFLEDTDVINSVLVNLDKKSKVDDILWSIEHVNKFTSNINTSLSIINWIKETLWDDFYQNILKKISNNNDSIMSFTWLLKNNTQIEYKHYDVYKDINNLVVNNIQKINDIIEAKNNLNTNNIQTENKEITKEIFSQLSDNIDSKLDNIEPETKKELLKYISTLEWSISDKQIEKIYSIIKKSENFEDNYLIVLKTINDFKAEEDNKDQDILNWWWGNEKLKCSDKYKTNDEIDLNKIKEEYSKLIEWKNLEEQLIIRDNFINSEFPDANENQRKSLIKMLIRNSTIDSEQITFVQENIKEFVEYMDIKEANPDSKIDFKEYIEIKPKLDDPSNNYFIPSIESYTKSGSTYTLEWKHWEQIQWLTEREMKNTLWNPEATENLINFYKFFQELNLEWVWEYRNNLILAIWDITINPNDANSINEAELRKFWNKLLTVVKNIDNKDNNKWNTQVDLSNINSVSHWLKSFSWAESSFSDSATFNNEWEDKFISYLRSNWIIWWLYFKTEYFRTFLS